MITIELTAELVQETLIALRDRRAAILKDQRELTNPAIQATLERQLARVQAAGEALAAQMRETF